MSYGSNKAGLELWENEEAQVHPGMYLYLNSSADTFQEKQNDSLEERSKVRLRASR